MISIDKNTLCLVRKLNTKKNTYTQNTIYTIIAHRQNIYSMNKLKIIFITEFASPLDIYRFSKKYVNKGHPPEILVQTFQNKILDPGPINAKLFEFLLMPI